MAAAFIGEAKSAWVRHACAREANSVIKGGSANEAHVAHLIEFVFKAKGARRGDFAGIDFRRNFQFKVLLANQGMVEKGMAAKAEAR